MSGEFYTAAEIDAVAGWLRAGLSAAKIAAEFGRVFDRDVSRNGVIGLVHRRRELAEIGLRGKGGGQRRGAGHPLAARPPRAAKPKPKDLPKKPAPAVLPAPVVARPDTPPMAFLDAVDACRCLHFAGDPLGPDGPTMPVCGAPRATTALPHNRYCAFHNRSRVAA